MQFAKQKRNEIRRQISKYTVQNSQGRGQKSYPEAGQPFFDPIRIGIIQHRKICRVRQVGMPDIVASPS